jgi:uncharacterized protein YlxW (UPF0749 family)
MKAHSQHHSLNVSMMSPISSPFSNHYLSMTFSVLPATIMINPTSNRPLHLSYTTLIQFSLLSGLAKIYTDNLKKAAKVSPASSAYDSFRRESSSQVEQLVRRIEATRKLGGSVSVGIIAKGRSAARRESKLTCAAH